MGVIRDSCGIVDQSMQEYITQLDESMMRDILRLNPSVLQGPLDRNQRSRIPRRPQPDRRQ